MKLDVRSFFMDIHKKLLYERMEKFLRETYRANDLEMLLYLLRETIFNGRRRTASAAVPRATGKGCHGTRACSIRTGCTGCPSAT